MATLLKILFLPIYLPAKFISIVFFTRYADEMPSVKEWLELAA